jgi:hypothetical protein
MRIFDAQLLGAGRVPERCDGRYLPEPYDPIRVLEHFPDWHTLHGSGRSWPASSYWGAMETCLRLIRWIDSAEQALRRGSCGHLYIQRSLDLRRLLEFRLRRRR